MRLAINGWPLIERPWSSSALHMLEWLDALADVKNVQGVTLYHPAGKLSKLPSSIVASPVEIGGGDISRLCFEQNRFPKLAASLNAEALFHFETAAPLLSPLPIFCLDENSPPPVRPGVLSRLRRSIGRAGALGSSAVFSYEDLPGRSLSTRANYRSLPPWVSGAFRATKSGGDDEVLDRLGLEEGFVFSLPAEMREVELFLAAWTWVDSSAGQLHPLVMAGLKERDRQNAMKRADELDLGETVRILERVNLKDLPALYRGGKVFLHGQSFGWGQELRWALACGTPVAGVRSALTVEIVQEAGYLVDPLDSRGLAAACITLLVEDEISSRLRQLGLIRARGFHEKGHIAALERSFEELLG